VDVAWNWLDFMAETETRTYSEFFCDALNHALCQRRLPQLGRGAVVSANEIIGFVTQRGKEITHSVTVELEFSDSARQQLNPIIGGDEEDQGRRIANTIGRYSDYLFQRTQAFRRFPDSVYAALYQPN
jgi:hypothetical protein